MSMNTEQFLQQQIDSLMISVVLKQSELESLKRERAMLVGQLKQSAACLHDVASGKGGWAWEEVYGEIMDVLSATEPQATQWLEEHDAEALEEAAKICDAQFEKDRPHQINGNQPDDYVTGYADGSGDCGNELRRLAASKRKEQVSPESDIDQLTRTI